MTNSVQGKRLPAVRRLLRPVKRLLRPTNTASVDPLRRADLSYSCASGITVRVRSLSDWRVFNEVFVDRTYDPAIDLLLARAGQSSRPLIMDLGANVGIFTARVVDRLVAAGTRADLVLVEGSPTMYRELQSRLPELASEFSSISPMNALVGKRDGSATIAEVEFGARNTLFPQNNLGLKPIAEMVHHEVPFVDLTTTVDPSRRVNLLKCDIEGSEQTFLETYRSDLLPRTDIAVFEFHHRLCDVPACMRMLSESGLGVVASVPQEDETSLVLLSRDGG